MPHKKFDHSDSEHSVSGEAGAGEIFQTEHFTIRYAQDEFGDDVTSNSSLKKLAVEIVLHGPELLKILGGCQKPKDRDPFLPA